jgi:hypothetical protein
MPALVAVKFLVPVCLALSRLRDQARSVQARATLPGHTPALRHERGGRWRGSYAPCQATPRLSRTANTRKSPATTYHTQIE